MLGYFPGEPNDESAREFVMVTTWRDAEALAGFAGDEWRTPVVTEEEAPLVEEIVAHHYRPFDRRATD